MLEISCGILNLKYQYSQRLSVCDSMGGNLQFQTFRRTMQNLSLWQNYTTKMGTTLDLDKKQQSQCTHTTSYEIRNLYKSIHPHSF